MFRSSSWLIRRSLSNHGRAGLASSALSNHRSNPIMMGCVCYDPSVGDIWSGIQAYLVNNGVPFDYVLFTNYEAQVQSLVKGHIDLAWNGPLAHVMTEELLVLMSKDSTSNVPVSATEPTHEVVSFGMRDVDRDFQSVVIVRKDVNIKTIDDLRKKHVLTGSCDSPQAHLVPLYHLQQEQKITFASVTSLDIDLGKHGDTALGEVKALEILTTTKQGDAALLSKMMWDRAIQGLLPTVDAKALQETCEELKTVELPVFDHCQFDAILPTNSTLPASVTEKQAKLNDFGEALFAMDWNIPEQQRLMKLEGLKKEWMPPRQTGYNIVRSARGLPLNHHRPARNFPYLGKKRSFSTSTTSITDAPSSLRVAVIGAGVAGLQSIRSLQAQGFSVTAFESSSTVGGLWKSNYANFGVQVPKQLYEFQDFPMTNVPWGEYAKGPQVQEYIESYADAFGLRDSIRFNTKVMNVVQDSNTKKTWMIESQTKDGERETQMFDYLVVATGLYSGHSRHIPSVHGQEGFSGKIVHSSDFTDASIAEGKRVVVVGGGKSAVDCAIESSRAGAASVTLLQRTAHWPTPRKIAGLIPFQYVFLSRFGTALVSAHRGTFPGGSGRAVNAFRNSIVGPMLMRPVFGIVEELFALQFGLYGDLRPKRDVVSDFYDVALVLDSELKRLRKDGKVVVKLGAIEEYESDGTSIMLQDGSTLSADLVVSATGFNQDFSIFSDPITRGDLGLEKDGMYLYRYILPEKVQNLAFIGNVGAISNISTYGLQAEWLARNLNGTLVSGGTTTGGTNTQDIHDEIEARKTWARSWMPESAYRGMLVLLHQTHYHDQLLRDMGLNPYRKSNFLSEHLMPYEPADYDGIMGGSSK